MPASANAKHAAAYRLASSHATGDASDGAAPELGPHVTCVLGRRFLDSTRGQRLVAHRRAWLQVCEAAFGRLLELVPAERLRQVYRAALRVDRQVEPAAYELHSAAVLADVVRGLELDVPVRGRRRADLRATFLSRQFHVEVKTHEDREGRRGGLRAARALLDSALRQCAPHTPNLVVLGRVGPGAVRRVASEQPPGCLVAAFVWLDLRPQRATWRAELHPVAGAQHPFPAALIEILARRFERR